MIYYNSPRSIFSSSQIGLLSCYWKDPLFIWEPKRRCPRFHCWCIACHPYSMRWTNPCTPMHNLHWFITYNKQPTNKDFYSNFLNHVKDLRSKHRSRIMESFYTKSKIDSIFQTLPSHSWFIDVIIWTYQHVAYVTTMLVGLK